MTLPISETTERGVLRALEAGEMTVEAVATHFDVGLPYVQKIKRQWMARRVEEEERAESPRPAIPSTQVKCLVADAEISARACVDAQVSSKCWCSKAVQAVNEVSLIAMKGSRLEREIETCKATAQAMLRKPAADRYDGPALRKVLGLPEPPEVPLPNPNGYSEEEDDLDEIEAAGKEIAKAIDNLTKTSTAPVAVLRRYAPEKLTEQRCKKCGVKLDARNTSGFCHASPCQKALAQEKADAAPRCASPGCSRPSFAGKRCSRCVNGTRPDGGYTPCATAGCPKRIQSWRGEEKCHLCRRGLTSHLKEKTMSQICKCGRELRIGRDGVRHDKCLLCRRKAGERRTKKPTSIVAPSFTRTIVREPSAAAPDQFPGMPAFDQVPIGWTIEFLKYLRASSIAIDGLEKAA